MDLYLGMDLGTTNMKAVIMDCGMNVRASAECPSPMIQKGSLREFDAEDFCQSVFALIQKAVQMCGGEAPRIRALSAASASGNTLFLDKNDAPMANVISWTDRRVKGLEEQYLPGFDFKSVHETVGWPYIGMFPLTHIALIKKERPEVFRQHQTICMSTEYLYFRLCGAWGLDSSDATTFYLQNQLKGSYHRPYLDYFGIGQSSLPPIYPPKTPLGSLRAEAAAQTGLPADTKVVLGSFDHPACARGMGAFEEGDLLLSCGTSWAGLFVSENRDAAIRAGLLVDPYLREQGLWACIFAMTQYGETIDKRICRYIDSTGERFTVFGRLAGQGDAGRGLVCDLEDESACREIWRGRAREEIACSIMASSCCAIKKHIEKLRPYGFLPKKLYMAGGPSSGDLWPQIMADTFQKKVFCLHKKYGGAVGAAMMAAIGDGRYADEKDFFASAASRYKIYEPREKRYVPDEAHGR